MRRALVAPLMSILLPGLGQLINRQAGKGAALVAISGLIALLGVGLAMYKLNKAMVRILDLPQREQTLDTLSRAMWQEGVGYLGVLGVVFLIMLAFSIWDAHKVGKRLDMAEVVKEG
jgi:hypothetical protein